MTISFRSIGNEIEITFSGGFKDSFDTTGAGKKKAKEVMNEFIGVGSHPELENKQNGLPPQIGSDAVSHRGKRKQPAAILAMLLGGAGAHKFYLGNWGIGLIYLISCFVIPGLSALIAIIEAIRLFTLSDLDFDNKYNYQNLKPFQVVW